MKTYSIVLSFLIVFTICIYPQKLTTTKKSLSDRVLTIDTILSFRLNDSLPKFYLHYREYYGSPHHTYYFRVTIRKSKKEKPFQVIKSESDAYSGPLDFDYGNHYPGFRGMFVDINFDGYTDLRFKIGEGGGPYVVNQSYNYYIYSPAKGLFELNEEVSDITNPTPDKKQKHVLSYTRECNSGIKNTIQEYKWEEGELVLLKSYTYELFNKPYIDVSEDNWNCKYKRYTNIYEKDSVVKSYSKTIKLKDIPKIHLPYW